MAESVLWRALVALLLRDRFRLGYALMLGKLGKNMARRKAVKIYRRGLAHANASRYDDAIAAYSSVVEMRQAPLDVRSMARLNRALVYSLQGNTDLAGKELTIVIHDDAAPESVKATAQEKLKRLERRTKTD